MKENKRDKVIALIITVVFHASVVALLVSVYLQAANPEEQVWPPVDESELLLEGEYVMAGDIPEPGYYDEPAPQAEEEAVNEPEPAVTPEPPVATPPQPISPAIESPMKVNEKPQPQISEEERQRIEEEKRREQTAKDISRKVAFGKNNSASSEGNGTGHSGQPDGNSASGALSGTPAANLRGRTLEEWENPRGTEIGTIVISVRVDRQGRVISASYSSGTGTVAANQSARNSCIQAAKRSRFSVDLNARAEQTGTITYRFK